MEIIDWVKKQTGKIADNVKDYKFYVKHTPNYIDSSTTLTLTSFANRDQNATIPCIYKWFKIKNGLTSEVPEFKGNSFICQPGDIGAIIQAQITSTDSHHPGTAILKFGPVKFDVMIKKDIQHSLAAKSAVFNVDLIQKEDTKECQIRINDQTIRISHSHSNVDYTFDYNLNEPRIQPSIKAPSKINIMFNEKYEIDVKKFINQLFGYQDMSASLKVSNQQRIQMQFPNRNAKDKFLFVLKAYNTRRILKNAAVIQKIQNLDFNEENTFNAVVQIESLKADLVKLNRINEKYCADKKMYYSEARKLEKEIEEIIVTYTKIAEGKCQNQAELDQSVMELREKKDEVMERKLHALMNQNQALRDRIDFLSSELQGRNNEPGMAKSQSDQPMQQSRGGFIKKRQIQEIPANSQFNSILSNIEEQQKKQLQAAQKIKNLTQQKVLLAKKLNESVLKVSKLEKKLNQERLNQTSYNGQGDISIDRKLNATAFEMGQGRNILNAELEQLKKSNLKLKAQNQQLKSEIPINSVRQSVDEKHNKEISRISELNPQTAILEANWPKRVRQLQEENERLKDQIEMLKVENSVLVKEKAGIQAKYKKKMGELMNQNSMYRRNQDALNRSQNLSMQMDLYNEEQTTLLKQQNEILSKQNQRLSKICDKYVNEAKQIPKLREQIAELKSVISK